MPRQPYSEAVPSDEEERFSPSPLRVRGSGGEVEPSLRGKSDANECNESSLSNCRVQLALSKKRDGVIFEKIPHQP